MFFACAGNVHKVRMIVGSARVSRVGESVTLQRDPPFAAVCSRGRWPRL